MLDRGQIVALHTQRPRGSEIDRPRRLSASEPRPSPSRLLDRHVDHRLFDLWCGTVLQDPLLAADLLQRQVATFVVQLLEPVKAIAGGPSPGGGSNFFLT